MRFAIQAAPPLEEFGGPADDDPNDFIGTGGYGLFGAFGHDGHELAVSIEGNSPAPGSDRTPD